MENAIYLIIKSKYNPFGDDYKKKICFKNTEEEAKSYCEEKNLNEGNHGRYCYEIIPYK